MELQTSGTRGDAAAKAMTAGRTRRLAGAAAAGLVFLLAAGQATAATYRYSASSNRIYVEGGGTGTLTEMAAAVPVAPIALIDAANKIWLLSGNLIVAEGTRLDLHGGPAGDVNELRMQSNAGADYVSITADHGHLHFQNTKVTSWNTNTAQPDLEYATGRAFIRARSRLDIDGTTPLESRMDIIGSEIAYLGFDAGESYGLVWKVSGTTPANITDLVNVRGDIINSNIHHLFEGPHSYGLEAGQWTGNHIHHNVSYGLYPHNDSDNMVIANNDVHDNGAGGIYVTEQSDHATIRGNQVYANTGHGIRLRNGSHFATVEDNQVHDNTDSGIALFGVSRSTITGNTINTSGTYGIRVTQASNENTIADNDVAGSARQGIYIYTDAAAPALIPTKNRVSGNDVHDNVQDGLRFSGVSGTIVTGNTLLNNAAAVANPAVLFENAPGSVMGANRLGPTLPVKLIGTADIRTTLRVANQLRTNLRLDAFSTANFVDGPGGIYDVSQNLFARATPANAVLTLTTAQLGTTSATVFKRLLTVKPAAPNTVQVNVTQWLTTGTRAKAWQARSTNGAVAVNYTVGNLAAGVPYRVTKGAALIGTFTANAQGKIAFSVTPGDTTLASYNVAPAP